MAGLVGALAAWGILRLDRQEGEVLTALGEPIVNAADVLERAERNTTSWIDGLLVDYGLSDPGEVADHDGIRCWYSYPEGGNEPNDVIRCGPVAFADSEEDTYWMSLPVSFSAGSDGTEASIPPGRGRRTTALEAGEVLRRPDGRDAPQAEDIDLERPGAPVAEANAGVVPINPAVMTEGTGPGADGVVNGLGYSTEVRHFGTTDRVLVGEDHPQGPGVIAAPVGQAWLIFALAHEVDPLAPDGHVEHSLEVDGRTHPFVLDNEQSDDQGDEEGNKTFATLVPADLDDVTLVVAADGVEQGWSFASESRGDDTPDVFYRDLDAVEADGDFDSLQYTVTDEFSQSSEPGQVTVRFDGARLVYGLTILSDHGLDEVEVASGPDRALLSLLDLRAEWSNTQWTVNEIGPDEVSLVLEDGTQAEPLTTDDAIGFISPHDSRIGSRYQILEGFAQLPVWDVPADIERATLRVTPQDDDPEDRLTFDYQDGAFEFPLELGG